MKRALLALAYAGGAAACGTESDIPEPDGPFVPGPVSIAITDRGAPAANVPVFFQNADSTLVLATVTDFDGKASAELDGDGFVTVIEPRAPSAPREILSTFAGVQGGDELHLDLAPTGSTTVVDFNLQIQEDTDTVPLPALGGYRVLSTCGQIENASLTEPAPVRLIGCDATAADILVVSFDEFGEPLRSQLRRAVPLSGTQNFAADPQPYALFVDSMMRYRNVPGEVGFIGANRAFATDFEVIFDLNVGVTPIDASGDLPIKVPAESGTIAITASSTFPTTGEVGTQLVYEWQDAAGDYELDLGTAMLPRFIELPVYDAARRTASWSEAEGATEPEVVRLGIVVHRVGIPAGSTWEWRLVGERSGASVTFPLLPAEAMGFNFNPSTLDTVSVTRLTTAKLPAGYDTTARGRGFVPFKELRSGTSGRIVTQDLFEGEPIGDPGEEL